MFNIALVHPMLVHFPLALMPLAVLGQLVSMVRGQTLFERGCLARAAIWLLVLAAMGAILAAVFGDMALDRAVASGTSMAKLEDHETLGQLSAGVLATLAVVEGWFYWKRSGSRAGSWGALVAGGAAVVLLLTTAWFGGHLVYDLGVNVAAAR